MRRWERGCSRDIADNFVRHLYYRTRFSLQYVAAMSICFKLQGKVIQILIFGGDTPSRERKAYNCASSFGTGTVDASLSYRIPMNIDSPCNSKLNLSMMKAAYQNPITRPNLEVEFRVFFPKVMTKLEVLGKKITEETSWRFQWVRLSTRIHLLKRSSMWVQRLLSVYRVEIVE